MSAEAEGNYAESGGKNGGEDGGNCQIWEESDADAGVENGGGVRADSVKNDVSEVEKSGESEG